MWVSEYNENYNNTDHHHYHDRRNNNMRTLRTNESWWPCPDHHQYPDRTNQPHTHSNTDESFWSPQIRISAMHRSDSTSRPRLLSDTVWLRSRMLCKYFRCSSEQRFFGFDQPPPNQLRLRNMLNAPDCGSVRWFGWGGTVALVFFLLAGNRRGRDIRACGPSKTGALCVCGMMRCAHRE